MLSYKNDPKLKKIYRNGDWNFTQVDETLQGEVQKHRGSFVFAVGEATNHHHVITVENEKDMILTKMPNGSYMVELKAKATVSHPEHSLKGDLIVAPGIYKLTQRREKDWFSLTTRKVID